MNDILAEHISTCEVCDKNYHPNECHHYQELVKAMKLAREDVLKSIEPTWICPVCKKYSLKASGNSYFTSMKFICENCSYQSKECGARGSDFHPSNYNKLYMEILKQKGRQEVFDVLEKELRLAMAGRIHAKKQIEIMNCFEDRIKEKFGVK